MYGLHMYVRIDSCKYASYSRMHSGGGMRAPALSPTPAPLSPHLVSPSPSPSPRLAAAMVVRVTLVSDHLWHWPP